MTSFKQYSKISVTSTSIPDVFIIEPKVFRDERGWFSESFNALDFSGAINLCVDFVQDNHSFSHRFNLHGMHYQFKNTQGKLVRVVAGAIFDVVVDLRESSSSYGKWSGVELSAQNHKQLWIPEGLAHGFLVLSETAEFLYKTTDYYDPESEVCLAWNDPQVGIVWPLAPGITPNLSAQDSAGLSWEEAPKF
jgi:dTDP-4-dehydrorhamnose 3,5-epimerase